MSIAETLELAKIRIEAAIPASPVSLFKTRKGIDIVFANTIMTQAAIASGDKSYIGTYHAYNYDINELRKHYD
jgi:hypothetical protein